MGDEQMARVTFPLETTVDITFDASDIASQLDTLQIAELITELDDEVGDWEHTLLLYHHFAAQYEVAKSVAPELAALTADELRARLALGEEHGE